MHQMFYALVPGPRISLWLCDAQTTQNAHKENRALFYQIKVEIVHFDSKYSNMQKSKNRVQISGVIGTG